jgi:1-acyl-sn-glycerol-3-phosphate acyltransferase
MKLFYCSVCAVVRGLCRLFYRHKIYRSEQRCPGAAILAPNHCSYIDPPIVAASYPEEVHFLAKSSLFTFPLGWFIRKLNAHPVDTENPTDKSSLKTICRLLEEGNKVMIFPEGQRSADGKLGKLKLGTSMLALRCRCSVIPIYVDGTFQIWPRSRRFPKLFGRTACIFGSPISTDRFAHLNKKEAQEAMTKEIADALKSLRQWLLDGAQGQVP